MDNSNLNDYPLADEPHSDRRSIPAPPPQQIPVYMPVTPPPPKRKWSLFRFLWRTVISGLILISIILNIFFFALYSGGIHESIYFNSGDPRQKIALIHLDDSITMESAGLMRQSLLKAAEDDSVMGIILVIDSPGGGVVPSDMMTQYLRDFKSQSKKPVYASIQQLGASGAYWVASAADRIYAQNNSMVGSIGVIYINMVLEQTLKDKLGIEPIVIKSSRSTLKDKNSPFRKPTEIEIADIQRELDQVHQQFVDVISQGRSLPQDEVWKLATGEVYNGQEAVENKLVDRPGYLQTAIDDMTRDLTLANPTIVEYSPVQSFSQMLSARAGGGMLNISQQLESVIRQPRIQALWLGN